MKVILELEVPSVKAALIAVPRMRPDKRWAGREGEKLSLTLAQCMPELRKLTYDTGENRFELEPDDLCLEFTVQPGWAIAIEGN